MRGKGPDGGDRAAGNGRIAPPGPFAGNERFQLEAELGAGGMGTVYRAFDRERSSRVALKVLRSFDAMRLYRFKREFRALADVTHPNLVTLYELFSEDHHWFFTMEYLVGCSFLRYVCYGTADETVAPNRGASDSDDLGRTKTGAQPQPTALSPDTDAPTAVTLVNSGGDELPAMLADSIRQAARDDYVTTPEQLGRLRNGLRQLVEGLTALHRAGHLHRDVKPSNVMVTTDERVVLLDFGLVTARAQPQAGDEQRVSGTVSYMAPEQAAGARDLTEAADWYAVGVMLFEALIGARPFSGDPQFVLHAKCAWESPSPHAVMPEGPQDLLDLCAGLLAREPTQRPSASQIRRLLDGRPRARSVPGGRALAEPSADVALVGREQPMASLRQAFETAASGTMQLVRVHGPSGMGKSTLCQRFLDDLRRDGRATVLEGRCYEHESVPYKALDNLIDGLCDHLLEMSDEEAVALLPADAPALARLFPVLHRVPAIHRGRPAEVPSGGDDPYVLRRQAVTSLRALVRRLAVRRPVVLAIDDVQWGDVDSAGLLADLLAPPAPPLLVLLLHRSEQVEHSAFLSALSGRPGHDREISIDSLSLADARRLACALLAGDTTGGSDEVMARAEAIARESGGNPFFLHELTTHLREGRENVPHRVTLDDVLAMRLGHLPEAARRLADVIALAGMPISQRAALSALDSAEGTAALLALERARFAKAHGPASTDAVEPYHDRIREMLVARLGDDERSRLHEQIALALEQHGEGDAESLGVHWRAAGDFGRAGGYFERAAAVATETLAFDRAAALYAEAVSLREREDGGAIDEGRMPLPELRVALAETVARAGRSAEAAVLFSRAAMELDEPRRSDLERRAAEYWLFSGHIEEGLDAIRALLARVGARLPATPQRALASGLWYQLRVKLRGLDYSSRPESEIPSDELLRLDVLSAATRGLSLVDVIRGFDFEKRHLLAALQTGEPNRAGRALAMEAISLSSMGGKRLPAARRFIDRARAVAEREDSQFVHAWVHAAEAFRRYFSGEFGAALSSIDDAETMFARLPIDTTWERASLQLYRLYSLAVTGALQQYREKAAVVLDDARQRGDRYLSTAVLLTTDLAIPVFGPQATRDRLARATWTPQHGYHIQHYDRLRAQIQIALLEGRAEAALEELEPELERLRRSLLLRVQIIRCYAADYLGRLLLAAAIGSSRERSLLRRASRMARSLERERIHYASTFAALLRGGIELSRGHDERAVVAYRDAVTLASRGGMQLHATAARLRLSTLVGGDEAVAARAAAEEYLQREKVSDPDGLASLFAPAPSRVAIDERDDR